jgi:hypothetical protein
MEKQLPPNPYREVESTRAYRRLMMAYYFMVKHPQWFGKKVAWITSGGPSLCHGYPSFLPGKLWSHVWSLPDVGSPL